MDIDEFLDRELADLGHDSSYSSAQSGIQPDQQPGVQQADDSSPILESIKSNLSRGNLEEAEHAYIQLWRVLMQQKIKWNRGIYEQLFTLSRQFLGTLEREYSETKSKSSQISELIGRARSALSQKKRDMAIKIYSQVQEINNSIPNVFFQEKKILKDQIEEFYREISNMTENELMQKVATLVQQVDNIVEKINASISTGDIASATADYYKCIELYNQVPEGFLRQKNPLGVKILWIYKSLSISTEIFDLQKQLSSRQIVSQAQDRVYSPTTAPSRPASLPEKYPPPKTAPFASTFQHKARIEHDSGSIRNKTELAKKNIGKGFYNEARKNIEDVLEINPGDVEAITLKAKIKTLQ
ncbi:MAG TPA: hypothetical protein VJJ52_01740 [Candidatus Nanoarchaeia archaeon]|nr:hypothetical protein [Candidatus Nanoarchaeia archaeon]